MEANFRPAIDIIRNQFKDTSGLLINVMQSPAFGLYLRILQLEHWGLPIHVKIAAAAYYALEHDNFYISQLKEDFFLNFWKDDTALLLVFKTWKEFATSLAESHRCPEVTGDHKSMVGMQLLEKAYEQRRLEELRATRYDPEIRRKPEKGIEWPIMDADGTPLGIQSQKRT